MVQNLVPIQNPDGRGQATLLAGIGRSLDGGEFGEETRKYLQDTDELGDRTGCRSGSDPNYTYTELY